MIEKELIQLFPWVDEMESEHRELLLRESRGRRLRKGPLSLDQLQLGGGVNSTLAVVLLGCGMFFSYLPALFF